MLQRREGLAAGVLFGCWLAAAAMIGFSFIPHHYIYPWYLVPFLPVFAISVALGILGCIHYSFSKVTRTESIVGGFVLIAITGYFWRHAEVIQREQDYPVEDLRAAALYTRGATRWQAKKGRLETALFWRAAKLYDPYAHIKFKDEADFIKFVQQCAEEHRPLRIAVGMLPAVAAEFPVVVKTLQSSDIFETQPRLFGTEVRYTIHLFRLKQHPNLEKLSHFNTDR